MKKYILSNVKEYAEDGELNDKLQHFEMLGDDTMQVSDGYHTMDELYEHRIELFIALCRLSSPAPIYVDGKIWMAGSCWRSKFHSDGTSFDGWFILGIGKEKGEQITYHIPLSRWDDTNFAQTPERAYTWDGHTSDDVLERLKRL